MGSTAVEPGKSFFTRPEHGTWGPCVKNGAGGGCTSRPSECGPRSKIDSAHSVRHRDLGGPGVERPEKRGPGVRAARSRFLQVWAARGQAERGARSSVRRRAEAREISRGSPEVGHLNVFKDALLLVDARSDAPDRRATERRVRPALP